MGATDERTNERERASARAREHDYRSAAPAKCAQGRKRRSGRERQTARDDRAAPSLLFAWMSLDNLLHYVTSEAGLREKGGITMLL